MNRSVSGPRRHLIGTMNRAVIALAGALALAAFGLSWVVVAAPPNGMREIIDVVPILSFAILLFFLIVTSRVVGSEEGYIEMVSFLLTRRVPVNRIADVKTSDGLQLVLDDGRRMGTIAYGVSVLGHLLKYPRSARAAERIRAFIDSYPADGMRGRRDLTVETSVRWGAIMVGALLGAILFIGTVAINSMYAP